MFRKKKSKMLSPVKQRTIDNAPFELPEIYDESKKMKRYQRNKFVSPVYGTNVKDEVILPHTAKLEGDIDKKYDIFRNEKKITKEKAIERYGNEYYEFNVISGQSQKNIGNDKESSNDLNVTNNSENFVENNIDNDYNNQYGDTYKEDILKFKNDETIPSDNKIFFNNEFTKEDNFDDSKYGNKDDFSNEIEYEEDLTIDDGYEYKENNINSEYISEQPSNNKKDYTFYKLPPVNILEKSRDTNEESAEWIQNHISILNHTMSEFGIGGEVLTYTKGPTVIRYEIVLRSGVNVKKILNISDNIKMNLAAKDIRIEAPIPGKSTIGIEVPNVKSEVVYFGDILDNTNFLLDEDSLKVAIGLDIDGNGVYTSIASMPHGLVAGATGSGKSVCINTILMSLLYKNKPDELKLMLIDPKRVELASYNELPHLVTPVIDDSKTATAALKWAVEEMERRFTLFSEVRARDIKTYNNKIKDVFEYQKMPYIVIVVDELADLMMVSSSDVEDTIMRLTQKARACGIHLILATQRPSTDIVKGTIKSNIPTRLAFSVSSYTDSMTIIDGAGAEKLLGKGDMLFSENGQPKRRIQGAFISDIEIESVTDYIRRQAGPDYLLDKDTLVNSVASGEIKGDEYFEAVAKYVVNNNKASINQISKEFKIGFNRAQCIVELMEVAGIVSENLGSRAREVLVDYEGLEKILNQNKKW